MQHVCKVLVALSLVTACGPVSQVSQTQEAWDQQNDPAIMVLTEKHQYVSKFADLPLSGALAKTPWSDYYWPTYQGGLTYRWQQDSLNDRDRFAYQTKPFAQLTAAEIAVLSPAEKFDLYMGYTDYRTTLAERERTGVLTKKKIPEWEGLCHAWAPATLLFDEPAAVTVKSPAGVDIPFASSDIKGLLTMFLDHVEAPHTSFLGTRCEEDLSGLQKRIEAARDPKEIKQLTAELKAKRATKECRDTNAGAFHLVLTNQIGLMHEGFVVDVTRDDEVWNQAVYGFTIKAGKEKKHKSKGAAKGTVYEVDIVATMNYIVEVDYHQERGGYESEKAEESVEYRYRLELNENREIIGGEWASEEAERPDFLWKQNAPAFGEDYAGIQAIYEAARK